MIVWNPWHGCKKISAGCQNCYVYRRDSMFGKDSRIVRKTAVFDLPLKRGKDKCFKLEASEIVYTCMTSDFFLEDADLWREQVWEMIKLRSDIDFYIITKRIDRFYCKLPKDWGEGYPNVTICCTCENQEQADKRLPVFINLPIQHKHIIHEPMLEPILIEPYLQTGKIEHVICGGESGIDARMCDFSWILSSREQCVKYRISFQFKQTGERFRKDGKVYRISRKDQMSQAKKACIDCL